MTDKDKSKLPQYNLDGIRTDSFLGPLEAKVLDIIWATETRPMTVREVHQSLLKDSQLAYTTIMTTMNRLFEKGILDREIKSGKGGLFYTYWPKMEKEAFESSAIQEILASLIDKFGDKVIDCFVQQISIDRERTKKLRKVLDRLEIES